jgi:hypothetical protein
MQIHKFPLGFIITQIVDRNGERVLHVVWLAGENLKDWKAEALERLRAFGIEHGCKAIEADCRPGLALLLRPEFRTTKISVRTDICPQQLRA